MIFVPAQNEFANRFEKIFSKITKLGCYKKQACKTKYDCLFINNEELLMKIHI